MKSCGDILDFADIGDFVNQPVKTYSSGMFVRLAFAVAINIEPEILIVDEALSVGDVFFRRNVITNLKNLRKWERPFFLLAMIWGALENTVTELSF